MKNSDESRRDFLKSSASILALGLISTPKIWGMPAIIDNFSKPKNLINGVQIGVITYSFREMPDQSAEATLQYILDAGMHHTELMGGPAEMFAGAPKNPFDFRKIFPLMRKRQEKKELTEDETKLLAEFDKFRNELSAWRLTANMDKFKQLGKMYKKAGVSIYAFKPDTFNITSSDAEITYGMTAAKALGANQVTLEHPSNDEHTLRLGRLAEKVGVKVGYHGHEQQTYGLWDTALAQSKANALNLDFGHFVAAGNANPLDIIKQKHERIVSMHIKDRKSKANGGANLLWGTGDTPIAQALKLIRDNKYKFPATVEFEYKIPEGSNSVKEVKKCLEFCKNVLA